MTPAGAPTVFVIDDDDLVRAAIKGMLKSVGLHSETFGTAQEFLRSKRPETMNRWIGKIQTRALVALCCPWIMFSLAN